MTEEQISQNKQLGLMITIFFFWILSNVLLFNEGRFGSRLCFPHGDLTVSKTSTKLGAFPISPEEGSRADLRKFVIR
jgi:hypothetical protein